MSDSRIVITGANSYLGKVAVEYLRKNTPHRIVALVSPRATPPSATDERVRYLQADLASAPTPEIAEELGKASRVFHLAWTRSGSAAEVSRANRTMIEHLFGAMPEPAKLWFVSSVSASPHPFSVYGATKYEATQLVRSKGGSVLVCGLVVEPDPPRGPYKMLRKNVARFPFSFRVTKGEPLVFPLRLDDLGATLAHVATTDLAPAIYRMFSPPLGFNTFLDLLEQLAPRGRMRLPFSASLALKAAALAKKSRVVPAKLCDQVLTFLYKDADHLLSHTEIPGLPLQPCRDVSYFA